jgi:anaerobic selenocysteine-containing dehydrogenase
VQWPCNGRSPDGTERLYTDGVFRTSAAQCETFGHDLDTGAVVTADEYRARDPAGKAFLKPAAWEPPKEVPDDDYPLMLTTGRVLFQFHTRTKTARVPALQDAAPHPELEISEPDARRLGLADGERVDVESRRGRVEARLRIADVLPGHVFLPFHYGSWDRPGVPRAANELTLTTWDPVSKQPSFKYAAVRVRRARSR